jgi:hypothetical protein
MSKETKFLMDTLTKNLVLKMMDEFGLTATEAMDAVYNSQLYEKILDTETGLYYQSAGYNYEMLREEYLNGKFCIF